MADRQKTFPRKNRVPSGPRRMRAPRSNSVERSQRASERRPIIHGDATHKIFDGVCFHRPGTIATCSIEVTGIMVAFVAYNHTFSLCIFPNRRETHTQLECSDLVSWNIFQRRPHLVGGELQRVVLEIQVYDVLRITWQCRERLVLSIIVSALPTTGSIIGIPMQVRELIGRFPLSDANQLCISNRRILDGWLSPHRTQISLYGQRCIGFEPSAVGRDPAWSDRWMLFGSLVDVVDCLCE